MKNSHMGLSYKYCSQHSMVMSSVCPQFSDEGQSRQSAIQGRDEEQGTLSNQIG